MMKAQLHEADCAVETLLQVLLKMSEAIETYFFQTLMKVRSSGKSLRSSQNHILSKTLAQKFSYEVSMVKDNVLDKDKILIRNDVKVF